MIKWTDCCGHSWLAPHPGCVGHGVALSEVQPGWSRAFEEECRKTSKINTFWGYRLKNSTLEEKSLAIFIFKKYNVVMTNWWGGFVFMMVWYLCLQRVSLSDSQFRGGSHPDDSKVWNSEFLVYGLWTATLRIYAYETKGIQTQEGCWRPHGHSESTVPWMVLSLNFYFLKRAHLEFWKSTESDRQTKGMRRWEALYLPDMEERALNIFTEMKIFSPQCFRGAMPNLQTHALYFCVVGEMDGVQRVSEVHFCVCWGIVINLSSHDSHNIPVNFMQFGGWERNGATNLENDLHAALPSHDLPFSANGNYFLQFSDQ